VQLLKVELLIGHDNGAQVENAFKGFFHFPVSTGYTATGNPDDFTINYSGLGPIANIRVGKLPVCIPGKMMILIQYRISAARVAEIL
jgi:hypothetical protein